MKSCKGRKSKRKATYAGISNLSPDYNLLQRSLFKVKRVAVYMCVCGRGASDICRSKIYDSVPKAEGEDMEIYYFVFTLYMGYTFPFEGRCIV